MTKGRHNIIFDWSGTVVDDMPPVLEATNSVLRHAGRPEMDRDTFRREFRLPYTEFYEEHTPGFSMDTLEAIFRAAFTDSESRVTLLPAAAEFLAHSRNLGGRHFVLSSAPEAAVVAQARHLGIHHHFDAFHAGIVDKRKFVDQLLDQHGLDASNTFYIGDMVHDVETARHAGLFFVAVLTGYDFEHVLADAKPDLLVPDLGHLHDWLHAWPQAQKMAKF